MAVPQSKIYDKSDIFSFSIFFSNLLKNLSAARIIDDLDLLIALCKIKEVTNQHVFAMYSLRLYPTVGVFCLVQ